MDGLEEGQNTGRVITGGCRTPDEGLNEGHGTRAKKEKADLRDRYRKKDTVTVYQRKRMLGDNFQVSLTSLSGWTRLLTKLQNKEDTREPGRSKYLDMSIQDVLECPRDTNQKLSEYMSLELSNRDVN